MTSLQAYQSRSIRCYRIVESFRDNGNPSISLYSAVEAPLRGGRRWN